MRIKRYTYRFSLFIIFCIVSYCLPAQSVSIQTDRNQILIGERIHYDLLITLPSQGYAINFNLPDSLFHFEVIEKGSFDTMSNNGSFSLRRRIIFTSFDSGSWYIPSLPVTLEINNDFKKFFTDSVLINVNYSPADSTNELRDIKPIIEINDVDYFWLYVAAAVFTVLAIIFFLYFYFRKRKQKSLPAFHSTLSPFEEALKDIKLLSKHNLYLPEEVKEYHSQLGFILKRYYSRIIQNNLLNRTTGDLLLKFKDDQLEPKLISSIAEALRIGDAVKFAKYTPPGSENESSLAQVKQSIEQIEKNKQNKN